MKKYLSKFLFFLAILSNFGFSIQAMDDIVYLRNGFFENKYEVERIITVIKNLELDKLLNNKLNSPGLNKNSTAFDSLINIYLSSDPICDEDLSILKQLGLIDENNQPYRIVSNILESWMIWSPSYIDALISNGFTEYIFTLKNGYRILGCRAESIRKIIEEFRKCAVEYLEIQLALDVLVYLCLTENKDCFGIIEKIIVQEYLKMPRIKTPLDILKELKEELIKILEEFDLLENGKPSVYVKNVIQSWVSFKNEAYFFEEDFIKSKEELFNTKNVCIVS